MMENESWEDAQTVPPTADERRRSYDLAESIIGARARRFEHFPAELLAEPAWNILLELYAAQRVQRRVTVDQLAQQSAIPHTTTLRWMKVLDAAGYLLRRVDPLDTRRVYAVLTAKSVDAMYGFLAGGRERVPAHRNEGTSEAN